MVAQLESGRIVPIAVTGKSRSPLFPNVPTLAEVRPGAELRATWFGLFTQSGVPRPIVEKIVRDADRIMAEPAFRKRIYTDRAVEPAMERLEVFADFIRNERVVAERIVKDSGDPPR
jgi:tripartite-type tricarboxylate transporter receptor subunit TctC